jgi:hypothetical protein
MPGLEPGTLALTGRCATIAPHDNDMRLGSSLSYRSRAWTRIRLYNRIKYWWLGSNQRPLLCRRSATNQLSYTSKKRARSESGRPRRVYRFTINSCMIIHNLRPEVLAAGFEPALLSLRGRYRNHLITQALVFLSGFEPESQPSQGCVLIHWTIRTEYFRRGSNPHPIA